LALTLPTSGGRSVGIVRLRTNAPEFMFPYGNYDVVRTIQNIFEYNKMKKILDPFWETALHNLLSP
jgi:hypothetical protein